VYYNFENMPNPKEENYSKERLNQISELLEWSKRNTNYNKITAIETIKFFDAEKKKI